MKYDIIVVGGGISGVAASVAAAREGAKVLLVESFGSLGGTMSNALVYPFMRYSMRGDGRLLSDGIFTEMRKRKEAYGDTSWESFKFVFDDMVTEVGVEVLFHATVFEVEYVERRVKSVSAVTKSGVMKFEADYFIDATGDGDLIALSGCEFQLGRESDGFCQPMTTCFRASGVDIEQFLKDKATLQEKYKELRQNDEISNPRENILTFVGLGEGILHFNTTRVIRHNPVDAFELSRAEIVARRQISEMMTFMKTHSKAFEKASIVAIANYIGVRESRKLKGVHILTAEELKNCVRFDDAIALGNYEIDIHNPTGTGTELYYFKDFEYYQIPYRSLLPKEYDNMLVAGRCLSATHEAQAAVRILPICASLGQAAGTAVAVAMKSNTDMHSVDIKAVRERLIQNGAAL